MKLPDPYVAEDNWAGIQRNFEALAPQVEPRTRYAAVASAAALSLPDAEVVSVTGTTNITSIVASGARVVFLIFADVLTVTDGSNLALAGNFVTSANDTLTLVSDGTTFFEAARSAN